MHESDLAALQCTGLILGDKPLFEYHSSQFRTGKGNKYIREKAIRFHGQNNFNGLPCMFGCFIRQTEHRYCFEPDAVPLDRPSGFDHGFILRDIPIQDVIPDIRIPRFNTQSNGVTPSILEEFHYFVINYIRPDQAIER